MEHFALIRCIPVGTWGPDLQQLNKLHFHFGNGVDPQETYIRKSDMYYIWNFALHWIQFIGEIKIMMCGHF